MNGIAVSQVMGVALALVLLALGVWLGLWLGRLLNARVSNLWLKIAAWALFCCGVAVLTLNPARLSVDLIWPLSPPPEMPEIAGSAGLVLLPVYIGALAGAAMQNLDKMLALWACTVLVFAVALGWSLLRRHREGAVK